LSLRITPLTDPVNAPHSRRLAWLASDADSIPVGTAFLRLFTDPGQEHLAELTLGVHPAERRKRVGSRLLDAAVVTARDNARRCVIAQAEAGSPGDHFLAARGFRKVLTLRFSRLPLAEVDTTALAEIIERPHPGYRLLSWRGTVPDDLAETFAASRPAMDDMPMDDTNYGTVSWKFGGQDIPESWNNGRAHSHVAETLADSDLCTYQGVFMHDFASENAFRDTIDEATATELRFLLNLTNNVTLAGTTAIEYVQETASIGSAA